MRILAAMAAALLAGCGPGVVETAQIGEPVVERGRVSCLKLGYCFSAMTITGKPGMGFSNMCPGTQDALIQRTPVEIRYDDGTSERGEISRVVSREGACL